MRNGFIYLLLIGSAIFWGANFNLGKLAVSTIGPMDVVGWRFLIASLCMLVIYWMKVRPAIEHIKLNLWKYILIGVIGIFGTNSLVFIGLSYTSAINAALITAANPAVTIICSTLLLKERISIQQVMGVIISLMGVWFVITAGSFTKLSLISVGDILVLCGNSCWALYGVLGRKYLKGSHPLETTTLTMFFGAICFIPFISIPISLGSNNWEAWMAILVMAILGTVLAYLWWNKGISDLGANRTGVFFNLVPISSMIIGSLTGESLYFSQLFGAFLVITGIIISIIKLRHREQIRV